MPASPKTTTAQASQGNTTQPAPGPSIPSGLYQQQQKKTPPTTSTTSAHRHRISLEDDHEIYLQLMAGENKEAAEKTANQLQLEERARLLDRRSRDPAVTDPNCGPGPVDFECAERGEGSSAGILQVVGVGAGKGGGGRGGGGAGGGKGEGKGR